MAYVNGTIDIYPKLCYNKNTGKKEALLMNYLTYLPVFDKLTKSQQDALTSSSFVRKFGKGELLHNGSQNCTGLLLVLSGQIRAFTISDDGREITMYRLFERDICLFSASCIMNSIQFDITVTAEKETRGFSHPVRSLQKHYGCFRTACQLHKRSYGKSIFRCNVAYRPGDVEKL